MLRRSRRGSAARVRESDTVARLGGDEFLLVLPGLDPAHATFEVMTVVRRVRESRSSRRSGSPTRRPRSPARSACRSTRSTRRTQRR
ncbi:MAG: diguanylate cyclase [Betaproteobacteria bacterium]|nr:diguanylate cyclase [Betaproteobacteria bacterium]